jgi:hypothetical protein
MDYLRKYLRAYVSYAILRKKDDSLTSPWGKPLQYMATWLPNPSPSIKISNVYPRE